MRFDLTACKRSLSKRMTASQMDYRRIPNRGIVGHNNEVFMDRSRAFPMNPSLDPLSLGHFSPIFPPFFPVFSPFSPSGPKDSRNRHQDPEKRSATVEKRSQKGGLKPFNRKRRVAPSGSSLRIRRRLSQRNGTRQRMGSGHRQSYRTQIRKQG